MFHRLILLVIPLVLFFLLILFVCVIGENRILHDDAEELAACEQVETGDLPSTNEETEEVAVP